MANSHRLHALALVISGAVLLVCPPAGETRAYNTGLVFYDLKTQQPYLPPTISVSRGRILSQVQYSTKGSIWSTFGQPCRCEGVQCECCAGVKVLQYQFDKKLCSIITLVPIKEEAIIDVRLNNATTIKYGMSTRNPSPACLPLPLGVPTEACMHFTNVGLQGNNMNMCMDVVMRVGVTSLMEMHFQCMRFGLDGVQYVDKDGQPVIPPSDGKAGDGEDEYYDEVQGNGVDDEEPEEVQEGVNDEAGELDEREQEHVKEGENNQVENVEENEVEAEGDTKYEGEDTKYQEEDTKYQGEGIKEEDTKHQGEDTKEEGEDTKHKGEYTKEEGEGIEYAEGANKLQEEEVSEIEGDAIKVQGVDGIKVPEEESYIPAQVDTISAGHPQYHSEQEEELENDVKATTDEAIEEGPVTDAGESLSEMSENAAEEAQSHDVVTEDVLTEEVDEEGSETEVEDSEMQKIAEESEQIAGEGEQEVDEADGDQEDEEAETESETTTLSIMPVAKPQHDMQITTTTSTTEIPPTTTTMAVVTTTDSLDYEENVAYATTTIGSISHEQSPLLQSTIATEASDNYDTQTDDGVDDGPAVSQTENVDLLNSSSDDVAATTPTLAEIDVTNDEAPVSSIDLPDPHQGDGIPALAARVSARRTKIAAQLRRRRN